MDTKYVATFLLVAVMITRIQCGLGDDCTALTQCMVASGLSSAFSTIDAGTVRTYFNTVCSKIDDLVSCFSTRNVERCSTLQTHFPYLSMANKVTGLFTTVCAQKEAIIGAAACIKRIATVQTTAQCTQTLNIVYIQDLTTISCSKLSEMTKCIEMTGQCSAKDVSIIGSIIQKRSNITCSAPKMVVNVLLLCMLYMLNRFLLF